MIWEELKFFLERLKNLPVSESLTLKDNCFCVSTGCDFESWIYFPEKIRDEALVNEAVKFFNERNISFMWPIYDERDGKILESCGLLYAGNLEAMTLDSDKIKLRAENSSVKISRVNKNFEEWAKTAWHSFGGEIDDVPKNYFAFVEALNNDRENLALYLSEVDEEPAGTFLITQEKNFTGVYYFAVMPEIRRKKVAASMMNEICRLSQWKKITLQATPSGVPFYENFGFDKLFTIPVYSNESDVF